MAWDLEPNYRELKKKKNLERWKQNYFIFTQRSISEICWRSNLYWIILWQYQIGNNNKKETPFPRYQWAKLVNRTHFQWSKQIWVTLQAVTFKAYWETGTQVTSNHLWCIYPAFKAIRWRFLFSNVLIYNFGNKKINKNKKRWRFLSSQETGGEYNIGLGRALKLSYPGMHPLKAAYIGIYKLSDAATKKDMSEHGRHTQATEVASLNRSRQRKKWLVWSKRYVGRSWKYINNN